LDFRIARSAKPLVCISVLLSGCGSSSSADCDDLWSKFLETKTLEVTTRGDLIEELAKVKPSDDKITEIELRIDALERISDDWSDRIQVSGC